MNAKPARIRTPSIIVLAIGVVLIVVYFLLKHYGVVGQPTDIGGGLILLLGYIFAAGGLIMVISNLVRTRNS